MSEMITVTCYITQEEYDWLKTIYEEDGFTEEVLIKRLQKEGYLI